MARPKVVVVGAGISGVVAALQLQKSNGVDVVLLEASQRVGGRIWSNEFGGEKIEMGANWIHGTHGSPVMKIAESHGLLDGGVGPWGGTRWTGRNCLRFEGGADVDQDLAKEVRGIYRNLVHEAHAIGSEEEDKKRYFDKNGREVGVDESVGAFLRNGFMQRLLKNNGETKDEKDVEIDDDESDEEWEDDWAGAEAFSEPGQVALAYQTTPSASAGERREGADNGPEKDKEKRVTNFSTLEEKKINGWIYPGKIDWLDDDNLQRKAVFDMRMRLECCISAVDSLEDLSSRSFGEYLEYPGPHITIASGYSRVVEILTNQLLPGTLIFNQEVSQIQWSPSANSQLPEYPVTVVTSEGVKYLANHVITTVSLGVLKERAAGLGPENFQSKNLFCPELPEWKLEAIRRMGFGTVDKVFLQFPKVGVWGENAIGLEIVWNPLAPESQKNIRPKWNGMADGYPPSENPVTENAPYWTRNLYAFYPINVCSPVVVTWIAGREAASMELESEENVKQACMDVIRRFLPEKERNELVEPVAILRSKWGTNPLFRGSYSYVAVGSSGDDIDTLAKPLPEPMARLKVSNSESSEHCSDKSGKEISADPEICPLQILFAGEATHRNSYSNTHGAFHAGIREAKRILKHYGLEMVSLAADDMFTQ